MRDGVITATPESAAEVTAANVHDSRMLAPLLDAVAPVRTGRRGRPRRRPEKLHADKGYDYRRCRDECAARGMQHRIARKGIESKDRLGRHRGVAAARPSRRSS